jgi:hypothetical protein
MDFLRRDFPPSEHKNVRITVEDKSCANECNKKTGSP